MGKGKVILLGAGPGDPGFLTIKGREYLEKADCIIYDRLISPELLSYAADACEKIYAGKENHHHIMKQEEINELLYRKAMEYPLTVRLKGGDPYVFGRGGEEGLYLTERGIEVEVVPGISSAIAVPAAAGIPVTHRGLSRGFQVVTAHSRKDGPAEIDYSQLLDPEITDLFLMGLSSVEEIAEGLIGAGRSADTPAAVISHGTTAGQRICRGTLADIAEKTRMAELTSPAIIVVGDVVKLSEKLKPAEGPLKGKTFLVPYIGHMDIEGAGTEGFRKPAQDSELAAMLREAGAEVHAFPVGRIVWRKVPEEEMRQALESRWLVFTSTNGVDAFVRNLKQLGLDARAAAGSRLAAIGSSTAAELEKYFLHADLVPEKQNGRALAETLGKICRTGEKIALFTALDSNPEVMTILQDSFEVRKVAVYENCRCGLSQLQKSDRSEEAPAGVQDAGIQHADGIFFTSASSVRRTMEILPGQLPGQLPAEIYSIGPKCTEEIRRQGIHHYREAAESSYRGLLVCAIEALTI